MSYAKPILALGLLGAGIAALVVGLHVQRDRFAFTSRPALNSAAPASPGEAARPRIKATALYASTRAAGDSEIPTVTIEALPVLPRNRPAREPAPAADSVKVQDPPCNPKWRSLESGPIGRIFRDICPAPGGVPRS